MISPLAGVVPAKPGSATRPLPGVDAAVLDEEGNDVPTGTPGEIICRGYTVMLGTEAALCVNPLLQKNVGYDSERDFEYVSMIGVQPNVLYVHPSVPAKTFQELVALVKANPGKFNFGSGGLGTTAHLAGEQLKTQAGLDMTHVPFRGTGPAVATVVSGHIQMAFKKY